MNYSRQIFVFLLALITISLFSLAVVKLWQGKYPAMSWLGLMLASAAPPLYLAIKLFYRRQAISLPSIGFSILCGLGLAISMTSSWKYGGAAGNAHLGAGLCLVLLFVYLRWIEKKTKPGNRQSRNP